MVHKRHVYTRTHKHRTDRFNYILNITFKVYRLSHYKKNIYNIAHTTLLLLYFTNRLHAYFFSSILSTRPSVTDITTYKIITRTQLQLYQIKWTVEEWLFQSINEAIDKFFYLLHCQPKALHRFMKVWISIKAYVQFLLLVLKYENTQKGKRLYTLESSKNESKQNDL